MGQLYFNFKNTPLVHLQGMFIEISESRNETSFNFIKHSREQHDNLCWFVWDARVNSAGAFFKQALVDSLEMKKHLMGLEAFVCLIPYLGESISVCVFTSPSWPSPVQTSFYILGTMLCFNFFTSPIQIEVSLHLSL